MIDTTTAEYASHGFFWWCMGAFAGWIFAKYRAARLMSEELLAREAPDGPR